MRGNMIPSAPPLSFPGSAWKRGHEGGSGGVAVGGLAGRLVPRDRAVEAFRQFDLCFEAEELPCPRRVETAPRLAVGLAGIQADLPPETGLVRDQRREFGDADLVARAEVHRVGTVVLLCRQVDRPRRVLNVKELTRRLAGAPDGQHLVAALAGLDALADQRRDDV